MRPFIKLVEQNRCLWEPSHVSYKDIDQKDLAWKTIANAVGYPDGPTAKREWKKVRDNYRDSIKRRRDFKAEHPNRPYKLWKYQKEMEFLLPHMSNRSTNDSTPEIVGQKIKGSKSEDDDQPDEVSNVKPTWQIAETYSLAAPNERVNGDQTENPELEPPNKKRKAPTPDTASFSNELRPNKDPLQEFFSSMYHTTKNLPHHLQLQIKRKIFDAVTEAEEFLASS